MPPPDSYARTNVGLASVAVVATLHVAAAGVAAWMLHKRRRRSTQPDPQEAYVMPAELAKEPHGPYQQELQLAIDLAIRAGQNMVSHCQSKGTIYEGTEQDLGINTKGQPEDFCTAIDLANEELIEEGIKKKFPSHKVIGEETTGTGEIPPLTNDPTWIIDPIDGTTNFASGLPLTCVSIGLCDGGRPVLGVIYAPMTNEMYVAVRGRGAFRNGVHLIQQQSAKKKTLSEAVVGFEFGYTRDSKGISKMVGAVQRLLEHGCRTTRSLGTGVLDLCYVATGRIDVVYSGIATEGWKPWDYCAGLVVATEAGCSMESLWKNDSSSAAATAEKDTEFDIYSSSIICAVNQELLEECRQVVCGNL